jgi:7,8-dihydropterin-6-yl-methyl-4-(beta-D-ribofuranosyl)aminobenzene 5'-phosphate synthase
VSKPLLIADSSALVTGEIPRKTSFEKGYPQHRAFINGRWEPDPWIWDERALVIDVKRKGLIILSGCSHAGIINTISYAQHLTGIETVYAVLGGFHLGGREFEKRINQTVEELRKISPKIIVPSHCTGRHAIFTMHKAMLDSFVYGSVGNLYML